MVLFLSPNLLACCVQAAAVDIYRIELLSTSAHLFTKYILCASCTLGRLFTCREDITGTLWAEELAFWGQAPCLTLLGPRS